MSQPDPAALSAALLTWYDRTARSLPWRQHGNAYHVWLSEIMLQQTQITTVLPYFARFVAAFPDVRDLAAAPLDQVLKLWEGLGYYSRARNLHRAAGQIVHLHNGQIPTRAAQLETLPGIGRYTANAIASIAFGERVPVLDGNVMRVLARLYDIAEPITRAAVQRRLWALAGDLVPADRPGDHNQAMMDLGRVVCRPRRPLCEDCPLAVMCAARQNGTQEDRPVRPAKPKTPHYDLAAGVLWSAAGQVLIAQRPPEGLLGGLWEFPAGRCAGPETVTENLAGCLRTALRDKLDIDPVQVEIGALLLKVRHGFTHFRITLHVLECRVMQPITPQPIGYADWRWARLEALDQFAFARADRRVIDFLREQPMRLC